MRGMGFIHLNVLAILLRSLCSTLSTKATFQAGGLQPPSLLLLFYHDTRGVTYHGTIVLTPRDTTAPLTQQKPNKNYHFNHNHIIPKQEAMVSPQMSILTQNTRSRHGGHGCGSTQARRSSWQYCSRSLPQALGRVSTCLVLDRILDTE